MTLSFASADNHLDAERRAGLRRMRSVAVGLLLLAAVVYLLTLDQNGFLGFVNAGAEASMVGAIADWFAVVALFKHPLGIPVPHTALVQKRKEMFGRGLEEFVSENFLSEGIVSSRVRDAGPGRKGGEWLAQEANAQRVVVEAADVLRTGLARIKDHDVADFMNQVVVPRFMEEPISPIAGRLLQEIVEDRAHTRLVDLMLAEAYDWLEANETTFHDVVVERAPWWAPDAVNERVIHRLHVELVRWIDEIGRDPEHRSRMALDRLLRQFADDLLNDESTTARMESFKTRMLQHPQVTATYISLWNALRAALVEALGDPQGELVRRGVHELQAFGERLCADDDMRERIDERVASLAVFFVDRYGRDLTSVITHTIEEWDGEQAARKIELHVGKDLQFIRINGTIVGGLVGVIIHAVAVLVA